jgi:SAM-dependent methyltransferase
MRMRRGWEAEARNWARFARTPGHDQAHEELNLPSLLRLLPPPAGRALDLGCGEGRLSRVLHASGYAVTGVDASPTMVGLAAAHDDRQPVVQADAAALPFRDGTFDLVVAYMSLHDIDAMPAAVAEAGRVLRGAGRFCAAIPHPVNSAGDFDSRAADAPFVIAGSYLDSVPVTWTATRDDVLLTFHSEHRPFEAYSLALEAAGLLIEAIREVSPVAPAASAAAEADAGRWRRIPMFLQFRAVKPG